MFITPPQVLEGDSPLRPCRQLLTAAKTPEIQLYGGNRGEENPATVLESFWVPTAVQRKLSVVYQHLIL